MKNIKNALGMYAAMAGLIASDPDTPLFKANKENESEENRNKRIKIFEIERNKAKGLKEFIYGNESIWALNKKNADKKARMNNISLDSYNPPTK